MQGISNLSMGLSMIAKILKFGASHTQSYSMRRRKMGRLVAPLSDRKVKAAKPKEKVYRLLDGNGLVLEVKPNGTKVWRVRYTFNKKAKMYTIGEYPYVSLANARAETIEVKELLRKGIDPVEHRKLRFETTKTDSTPFTFKEIAEEFFELNKKEWAPVHYEKQTRRAEIYSIRS